MGFIDGIKGGLGLSGDKALMQPGAAVTKSAFPGAIGGTSTTLSLFNTGSSGARRGSEELLASYRDNPNIRKVVGLVANQLAAVPLFLGQASGGRGKSKSLYVGKAIDEDKQITEHPFLDFLYAGNPAYPGMSAIKLSWVYYLLKGEFFWIVTPLPDNKMGWIVVPPTWVQDVPGEGKDYFTVRWGNAMKRVPSEWVLWVRELDPLNPFGRGTGRGDSLRDEIDTDEYASQLLRTTMANKGLMEGVLSVEGASEEAMTVLRRDFERQHRGAGNSGRTLVVDGSAVKYQTLAQAFSELKLLELRAAEKTYIEQHYCIPPELFGQVSGSNRATIYHAQEIFAGNVLIPNLEMLVREVSLRLLPLFDKTGRLYLSYEDPRPQDKERRLELMRLAPEAFRLNEIRAEAGLAPEPWGDVRAVTANKIEIPAPGGSRGKKSKAVSDGGRNKAVPGAAVTEDQVARIMALYTPEELAERLGPLWQKRLRAITESELAALGVDVGFNVINPMIEAHLEEFALDRLSIPINTSRDIAAAQLSEGVAAGETITELAQRLRSVGATDQGYRARMIARTEVVRSSNMGRLVSWKASGLPGLRKRWISGLTATTRESHAALHNKTVAMDEVFVFDAGLEPGVAGSASVPGDATAAAHSINCVCTSVAFDPQHGGKAVEFGGEEHQRITKAFDAETRAWEDEAIPVIAKFYADLEREALRILGA